ncbi:hypothetical protein ACQY0O_008072 [Thecaphora frezii]
MHGALLAVVASLALAQLLAHVFSLSTILCQVTALLLATALVSTKQYAPRTPPLRAQASKGRMVDQHRCITSAPPLLPSAVAAAALSSAQLDSDTEAAQLDYAERIAHTRQQQCPQLVDAYYLDAAASPPYPAVLVHRAASDLATNLYSNPHSKSPSAMQTASRIEEVRARVIKELFCIDDPQRWELIFTSGATASLKLVGEAFDWSKGGFHHLLESHTSLAGIRDLASRAGALTTVFTEGDPPKGQGRTDLVALPLQCNATGKRYDRLLEALCKSRGPCYVLVDAASYLSSSQRLDLGSINYDHAPDFVAFSFYKIFGFPTGLGGLLVRKSSAKALCNKPYYGGGTLDAVAPSSSWKKPRKDLAAAFEDGTVNLHAILALRHAFDYCSEAFGDWRERRSYVQALTSVLYRRLSGIRHGNGEPMVRIYASSGDARRWTIEAPAPQQHDADCDDQGPILNFNLLSPTGRVLPPNEVDRLASISNIHLRAGRHCNAGFIAAALGTTEDDLKQQYAKGIGCDESSDSDEAGSTSLRASLCLLNTDEDIERLVRFLECFFRVADALPARAESVAGRVALASSTSAHAAPLHLSQIFIYPIKSCAGQALRPGERWRLTRHGLEYDREWVLVDLRTGKGLSQKKHPRMALIQPRIDLENNTLVIAVAGRDVASIELHGPAAEFQYERSGDVAGALQVCADTVRPQAHLSSTLRDALTAHLGIPCTLARQAADGAGRHSKLASSSKLGAGTDRIPLLFSNESPFLLINQSSVDRVSGWLQAAPGGGRPEGASACADPGATAVGRRIANGDRAETGSDSGYADSIGSSSSTDATEPGSEAVQAQASSFRSNFVVAPSTAGPAEGANLALAFVEDGASRFRIGDQRFGVLGPCRRCQMVCVDQKTGEVRPETLQVLARHRRNKRGRIIFGSHLVWLDGLGEGGREGEAAMGSVEVGMPVLIE